MRIETRQKTSSDKSKISDFKDNYNFSVLATFIN